jgi:hypothetical protein
VLSGARVKENCCFIVGPILHRILPSLVNSSAAGKTAVEKNRLEMMFSLSPEFTTSIGSRINKAPMGRDLAGVSYGRSLVGSGLSAG